MGPDKTGSTAIQRAFHAARDLLAESGVLYPLDHWHAPLGSCFATLPDRYEYNRALHRHDADLRAGEDAAYFARFVEALDAGRQRQLFISYEGFVDIDVDGLRRLAAFLATRAERVEVLAYCREPLGYAVSAGSQRVKIGVPPWSSGLASPYRDHLQRMVAAFGRESVFVRVFDRGAFPRGDVVADAMTFIGLPTAAIDRLIEAVSTLPANRSLSEEAMRIGQAIIERTQGRLRPGDEFGGRFLELLQSIEGEPARLPAAMVPAVLEAASPHSDYLRDEFGISFESAGVAVGPARGHGLATVAIRSVADLLIEWRAPDTKPPRLVTAPDLDVLGVASSAEGDVLAGTPLRFEIDVRLAHDMRELVPGIHIRDKNRDLVFGTNSGLLGTRLTDVPAGDHRVSFVLDAPPLPGVYSVGFAFDELVGDRKLELSWNDELCRFRVRARGGSRSVGQSDLDARVAMRPRSTPAYNRTPRTPFGIEDPPAMNVTTAELDAFVDFVDTQCQGNLRDARVHAKFLPFTLVHETRVDQSIDPFSTAYFDAQLALYREIAGRNLDQWSGELHPVDVASLLTTANPQGIKDVNHVSENVRAVSTLLSLAGLPAEARILDMGAGHGMSSEVYAFCGAQVHAVDIDAKLSELAMLRAVRRSLPVTRSILNFDSLAALRDNAYDAAFFFQALHHALRPWQLIAELGRKLSADGVIAFCGEPIQDNPWKNWGLRLDIESVYVARKYGWFESGWSEGFITECFARNGFTLLLLQGGHQGGLIGLATRSPERLDAMRRRAGQLGNAVVERDDGNLSSSAAFHSQIGTRTQRSGLGPMLQTQSGHGGGYLCYGPYLALAAGRYGVDFALTLLKSNGAQPASVVFDIVSGGAGTTHHRQTIELTPTDRTRWIRIEFTLDSDATGIETRALVNQADTRWEMSLPRFTRL